MHSRHWWFLFTWVNAVHSHPCRSPSTEKLHLQSVQVRQVGGLFGAGSAPALVMEAAAAMEAGEPVAMDFGPRKTGRS